CSPTLPRTTSTPVTARRPCCSARPLPEPPSMSEANYRDITEGLDPQTVAERVRDGMFANDRASQGLGMEITGIGPGYAKITMPVREDMLNGFRICHGGFIT